MIVAFWAQLALAGVTVDPPPVAGQESVVTVTDRTERPRAGVTVRVVQRHGLDGAREHAVGVSDGLGRVGWTPETGGPAEVIADRDRVVVHVRFRDVPAKTLTLLGLLATAAAGAAIFGLFPARGWRGPATGARR